MNQLNESSDVEEQAEEPDARTVKRWRRAVQRRRKTLFPKRDRLLSTAEQRLADSSFTVPHDKKFMGNLEENP